jgi:cytochrome b561
MSTAATSLTAPRYTTTALTLHWIIAVLILCSAGMGLYIGGMPLSPRKLQFIAYHKWNGITIFVLVALRLGWRATHPAPPLPANMPAWQRMAAHASHVALYILMISIPLVGWLQSSAAGVPVIWFGVLPLPSPLDRDKPLADLLLSAHRYLNYGLLLLIALHAAAAIKHHLVDRDDVLTRMLPFLRRSSPPGA